MSEWIWEYKGYDPAQERLRETLCTLGNGYFATRGAAPECAADAVHYPGTYAAGIYNRLTSDVAGHWVENEDMVNLPNWLPLWIRTPAGTWLSPDTHTLLDHEQTLDLHSGTLERTVRYQDEEGRCLTVRQLRLVSMAEPHLALLRIELMPEGWSGQVEVESALDGTVANTGVDRYRSLASRHLTDVQTGSSEEGTVWLGCRTSTSGIRVGLAARTVVDVPSAEATTVEERARVARVLRIPVTDGHTITVDKTIALHTSHDPAISDPLCAAVDRVGRARDADALLDAHRTAWQQLWRNAELDVPNSAGPVLRLHLFHVLQTLSPHTADLDVGVPARGLHGEAYRGHVFWDELFVLPYLNLHFPEVSRALLAHRHRRLERACFAAADAGHTGAMYPWQSGSDGREETQRLHLNPRSGRWLPDHSRLQHHVGLAIAYNVWQYCEATGDMEFLHDKGAEMLAQIARFWAGMATYDETLGRYRIRGVVGPDEYHDAYPDAERPGLDDNAYTNVTAAWVLARALDVLRGLPEYVRGDLFDRVGLEPSELNMWDDVSRTLHVPFHAGVISQFAGYGDLAELDWQGYRDQYGDIRRLDRILEAEGDTVNRYQASKQADVLMLGYLFSPSELQGLFRHLGYELDDDTWHRTVDYYLDRTSHGSTLSSLVHGWVLARAQRAQAWDFVQEALASDIADLQGGTTGEGIHLGAMGGTLDLIQRGLTGLETRGGALRFDPVPLPEMSEYGFSIRYQGHWGVQLRLKSDQLRITVPDSDRDPITVAFADRTVPVAPGESCTLTLTESGVTGEPRHQVTRDDFR
ncbi:MULTISPECIES: glycoside hydrolase family 65 protein [Streptomyces]|uniref:Glycoside hydrolase family 65 protein n=1 Tax=Streptomyces dengpaensis TaxID=2049881 RepID=A0ABM6SZ00_9ACTN|nr:MULTISPECIES: glycosyl hydrolase family 65 protein [Streptomyces]AVH60141.1 glycoside hydrolase family 65 protein [Streptomyces dengpaensis]PIB04689.1 trehalose 6-phosphate phosphorylase [Streptomyces sp. HG99]